MPRQKRSSRTLEKAELRAAGIRAIGPMELGAAYSIETYTDRIDELRNKIDAYNTSLAMIDSSQTEIEQLEKSLGNLTDQMLTAIAYKYGKDSREYEMAGGVRKSERIRRSTASRLKAREDGTAAGTAA